MTEKVQVIARIRALPTKEGFFAVVPLDKKRICVNNRRVYHVDRVYGYQETTEHIFYESVVSLVDRFIAGYNTTVIAYGQTCSGKTYTMRGITELVTRYICENVPNSTLHLSFQCVEVYGETLRDLLGDDVGFSSKHLKLHDSDGCGSIVVVGATRMKARSIEEIQEIIDHSTRMRTTGATEMNAESSRSHYIFTIYNYLQHSKLNLVDLAGSERNKKTKNVCKRFRESIAINGGLLALGNVIRALSRNHFQCPEKPCHVPYRSSKLTRILQDSLGGNSATLLIACVSPDVSDIDETTRTLQYSALSMHILNEPLPQFEFQLASVAEEKSEQTERSHKTVCDSTEDGNHDNMSSRCIAEVLRLRQVVATLEEQLQRCHVELKKDEAVFAKQIEEMRSLLKENEFLKQRVTFFENGSHFATYPTKTYGNNVVGQEPEKQQQQQQQTRYRDCCKFFPLDSPLNYVQGSLELNGITSLKNHNGNFLNLPLLLGKAAFEDDGCSMGLYEKHHHQQPPSPPPQQQQQQPINIVSGSTRNCNVSTANVLNCNDNDVCNNICNANANNIYTRNKNVWGGDVTHFPAREEQLGLLAKEALYYQRSNFELRERLRAVLGMYESQQREAAMLRLELQQIRELLDGKHQF